MQHIRALARARREKTAMRREFESIEEEFGCQNDLSSEYETTDTETEEVDDADLGGYDGIGTLQQLEFDSVLLVSDNEDGIGNASFCESQLQVPTRPRPPKGPPALRGRAGIGNSGRQQRRNRKAKRDHESKMDADINQQRISDFFEPLDQIPPPIATAVSQSQPSDTTPSIWNEKEIDCHHRKLEDKKEEDDDEAEWQALQKTAIQLNRVIGSIQRAEHHGLSVSRGLFISIRGFCPYTDCLIGFKEDQNLRRYKMVLHMLNYRLANFHYTRSRIQASVAVAQMYGKGFWVARQLRRWETQWMTKGTIEAGRQGKYERLASWLLDEELVSRTRQFCSEQKDKLTSRSLARFVGEYLKSRTIENALQRQLDTVGYARDSITDRSARRWLNRLGFEWKDVRKNIYIDGHDRPEVLEYRKEFLMRMEALAPRFATFDPENGTIKYPLGTIPEGPVSFLSLNSVNKSNNYRPIFALSFLLRTMNLPFLQMTVSDKPGMTKDKQTGSDRRERAVA